MPPNTMAPSKIRYSNTGVSTNQTCLNAGRTESAEARARNHYSGLLSTYFAPDIVLSSICVTHIIIKKPMG